MKLFKNILQSLKEHIVSDEIKKKYPDVILNLYEKDGKYLDLSKIVIPEDRRGQGIGSKIMQKICDYADSKNLIVTATPSTLYGTSNIHKIINYNKKFGFVQNKGSDKRKDIMNTMYRLHK